MNLKLAAAPATIAVRNPATGAVAGEVADMNAEEVAALASRAREAQRVWAAWSPEQRAAVLFRAQRWVLDNAEQLVDTVVSETGTAWDGALAAEIWYTSQAFGFWARQAGRWLADERVRSRSPAVLGRRLVVRHEPRGVIGVIAPWNYPLANSLGDCIPALAAGNAVVLKPSEETPLTPLLVAEGLRECGLPDDVLGVATGGAATGAAVIDNVNMVMFTGSTATGREVAARAGANLIPVSLELGGKDPMIVLSDADLVRAANCAVYYGLVNAGQTCISVERVYVEEPVYDRFLEMVLERVGELRIGDPEGGGRAVDVGAITLARQLDVIEAHVEDALAGGARALTGGKRGDGPGTFFEPTVLVDVNQSMRCMREETFGPTLPIMRVRDADEAVRLANDSDYGLGASVFTRDAKRGEAIARRLEAGNVAVNDAMVYFAVLDVPMGGWKQSGVGTRHGPGGIRKYCLTQSIVVPRRLPRRDFHWFPYRRWRSRVLLRGMRLASRIWRV